MDKLAHFISTSNRWLGHIVAWGVGLMVVITFAIVILRHGFDIGWIAMQESVLYLHAAVFLLGSAYTLSVDGHVRVDIFYQRFSPRGKAIADIVGTVLFLLPMCIFIMYQAMHYTLESWAVWEGSPHAGGLPGVYLLKTLIPVTALLVGLQGIALALHKICVLSNNKRERGQ